MRRECLEISDILVLLEIALLTTLGLEDTVLKLFGKVNVHIDPWNIEDCNRLKSRNNAPQKVIIKLSNRKDIYPVLKAKSSFKTADVTEHVTSPSTPIFLNQSLCSYYKFLWSKCKKLWLNKVIETFWVSKGSCRIRLVDNSVKIITHIGDLKNLFPGHSILMENAGRLYLVVAYI